MAHNKKEIEKLALEAIEKYKPIFIDELVDHLPVSERWFYSYKMQELQSIKDAISKAKTTLKAGLRQKWYKGTSHAAQIALYKLLANGDELRALNGEHKTEVTVNNGGPVKRVFKVE